MADDSDGYEAYYAGKLWTLLPQIYRALDGTSTFDPDDPNPAPGPLREIVNRIGKRVATVRRSIDRMWEDQAIESCDDWVIPYIGEQVSANLVASLDARGRRIEVARTIYDRQRRGTIPMVEEVIARVTGWDVRAIELYRRLARTRHGLDPVIAPSLRKVAGLIGRNTGTPAGGYADVRKVYGSSRAGTAFDEFSYTAGLRSQAGRSDAYNLGNVGLFLWRLASIPVSGVTPVRAAHHGNTWTFDPTGREVPLFAAGIAVGTDAWFPRPEYQYPTPIDAALFEHNSNELYAAVDPAAGTLVPHALGLYRGPPAAATLVPVTAVGARTGDTQCIEIDPARGRFSVPSAIVPPVQVAYYYGTASPLGAGGYDRRIPGRTPPAPPAPVTCVNGGTPLPAASTGTILITDSSTYGSTPDSSINGNLAIRADNQQRPLLRFKPPHGEPAHWTLTGDTGGSSNSLDLDAIFLSGANLVLAGSFDTVTLKNCTLDPGAWIGTDWSRAIDGQRLVASHLIVAGSVGRLLIDNCILGPVATHAQGRLDTLVLAHSVVQASHSSDALSLPGTDTRLRGCTVLGKLNCRQLDASDSVLNGKATVANIQQGCVRYSAWTPPSTLPSQYECVALTPNQPLFLSTDFGNPNYLRLLPSIDPSIGAGAADGSEMGVYARDKNPIKERSLLIRGQDSLPLGQTPVLIYVT